jgi:hypothetical protein
VQFGALSDHHGFFFMDGGLWMAGLIPGSSPGTAMTDEMYSARIAAAL